MQNDNRIPKKVRKKISAIQPTNHSFWSNITAKPGGENAEQQTSFTIDLTDDNAPSNPISAASINEVNTGINKNQDEEVEGEKKNNLSDIKCFYCSQFGHKKTHCFKAIKDKITAENSGVDEASTSSSIADKGVEGDKRNRLASIKCNYCSQFGHKKFSCFKAIKDKTNTENLGKEVEDDKKNNLSVKKCFYCSQFGHMMIHCNKAIKDKITAENLDSTAVDEASSQSIADSKAVDEASSQSIAVIGVEGDKKIRSSFIKCKEVEGDKKNDLAHIKCFYCSQFGHKMIHCNKAIKNKITAENLDSTAVDEVSSQSIADKEVEGVKRNILSSIKCNYCSQFGHKRSDCLRKKAKNIAANSDSKAVDEASSQNIAVIGVEGDKKIRSSFIKCNYGKEVEGDKKNDLAHIKCFYCSQFGHKMIHCNKAIKNKITAENLDSTAVDEVSSQSIADKEVEGVKRNILSSIKCNYCSQFGHKRSDCLRKKAKNIAANSGKEVEDDKKNNLAHTKCFYCSQFGHKKIHCDKAIKDKITAVNLDSTAVDEEASSQSIADKDVEGVERNILASIKCNYCCEFGHKRSNCVKRWAKITAANSDSKAVDEANTQSIAVIEVEGDKKKRSSFIKCSYCCEFGHKKINCVKKWAKNTAANSDSKAVDVASTQSIADVQPTGTALVENTKDAKPTGSVPTPNKTDTSNNNPAGKGTPDIRITVHDRKFNNPCNRQIKGNKFSRTNTNMSFAMDLDVNASNFISASTSDSNLLEQQIKEARYLNNLFCNHCGQTGHAVAKCPGKIQVDYQNTVQNTLKAASEVFKEQIKNARETNIKRVQVNTVQVNTGMGKTAKKKFAPTFKTDSPKKSDFSYPSGIPKSFLIPPQIAPNQDNIIIDNATTPTWPVNAWVQIHQNQANITPSVTYPQGAYTPTEMASIYGNNQYTEEIAQPYSPSDVYAEGGTNQSQEDIHEGSESSDIVQAGEKRLSAFDRLGPLNQPKKPKLTINLLCNKDQSVREVVDETEVTQPYVPVHLREDMLNSSNEIVMKYLKQWPWIKKIAIRKGVSVRQSKSAMLLEQEKHEKAYEKESWFTLVTVTGYPPFWKKEDVLDAVLESVKGKSFIPCFTLFTTTECKFFVLRSFSALIAIHKYGFVIRLDDVELIITISLTDLTLNQIDFIPRLVLRKHLSSEYDGERKLSLKEFTLKSDISHFIYFPLARTTNQLELMQLQSTIAWEYLTDLDLSCNNLTSINNFELQSRTPRLQHLDLSNNLLDGVRLLLPCRELPLKSIKLEGNPLCHDYIDPDHYIRVMRLMFPMLEEIDGVPIKHPGEFPEFKKNYCPPDAQIVVDKFLEVFFPLLDSPSEDRVLMQDLYNENAVMTITFRHKLRYGAANRYFRNLFLRSRVIEEDDMDAIEGAASIIKVLTKWPALEHDPYTFAVDVFHHDDTATVLRIGGIMKVTAESLAQDEHMLAFTRTIVLRSSDGIAYKIHNEMLYWDTVTENYGNTAFQVNRIKSQRLSLKLESIPDEDLKKKLIEIFMSVTGIQKSTSEKCLETKNWHMKEALEYLLKVLKLDSLESLRYKLEKENLLQ